MRAEVSQAVWHDGVFPPESVKLTPQAGKGVLKGLTILTGKALTFAGRDRFIRETPKPPAAAPARARANDLYREFRPRTLKPPQTGAAGVTLIPYFAWANRGVAFMEVWIPLAR